MTGTFLAGQVGKYNVNHHPYCRSSLTIGGNNELAMSDQYDFNEKEYGYFFHPREWSDSPGHPRLDVFLRSTPTKEHFDPMKMTLNVTSEHKNIELLKVHHPWSLREQYQACAGRVILQDRRGKKVEAFTFGGDLQIESEEELTIGALTSPAPILELISTSSIPSLLAEETEILFAERRAEWEPDHSTFNKKLIKADPLSLYCACLDALREKFDRSQFRGNEAIQHFAHFIHNEITALQELHNWPSRLPTVTELL
jgi:hypothetical protein